MLGKSSNTLSAVPHSMQRKATSPGPFTNGAISATRSHSAPASSACCLIRQFHRCVRGAKPHTANRTHNLATGFTLGPEVAYAIKIGFDVERRPVPHHNVFQINSPTRWGNGILIGKSAARERIRDSDKA
jgi:hypothetical protein